MRILASVALLISVFIMPFWVSLILAFLEMFYFHFFAEAVIISLISDLLYSAPVQVFSGVTGVFFIVSLVVFIILELLKKKIRLEY